jgi:hypothetical protein
MDKISSWGRNIVPGDKWEPACYIKYHVVLMTYINIPLNKALARIWYIFLLNVVLNPITAVPASRGTAGSTA